MNEKPGVEPTEEERDLEDWLNEPFDELDRELAMMVSDLEAGRTREAPASDSGRFRYHDVEMNRPMAVLTYCSILFAVPVFVVPMVRRQSEFALHHAKAAGAIWLLAMALLVVTFLNCALFLPLMFICYIPALIGMYRASAGVEAGKAALGDLGAKWFQKLKVKS